MKSFSHLLQLQNIEGHCSKVNLPLGRQNAFFIARIMGTLTCATFQKKTSLLFKI
jgi:hypothetical protein